jgi:hypothetical protein
MSRFGFFRRDLATDRTGHCLHTESSLNMHVELASHAIEYSSKRGENVLDLFGGSGSTLSGAERTGARRRSQNQPRCHFLFSPLTRKAESPLRVGRVPGRERSGPATPRALDGFDALAACRPLRCGSAARPERAQKELDAQRPGAAYWDFESQRPAIRDRRRLAEEDGSMPTVQKRHLPGCSAKTSYAEGKLMRPIAILSVIVALGLCVNVAVPDDKKPPSTDGPPMVVKDHVIAQWRYPKGEVLRITGKAKVLDANTLVFADGTKVDVGGGMDAPDLEQKGLIGESFYPCGKDAAEFLKKLVVDQTITFLAAKDQDADAKRIRGHCMIGETSLEIEMVRNGWAIAHHSGNAVWEIIARENKRGIWRGKFIEPERWRKGERLPGE